MGMTAEEGRGFWLDWVLSNQVKDDERAKKFANALADRLRTQLTKSGGSDHCHCWTTARPVSGVGEKHQTLLIAAKIANAGGEAVFEEIKRLVSPSDVAVVFLIGNDDTLVRLCQQSPLAMVVLKRDVFERFLGGSEDVTFLLHGAIRDNASDGLKVRLNPYWTQGPIGGAMFYGRTQEKASILSGSDSGMAIAVIGPRGIGKSSLLLSARADAPSKMVAVYINCEIHQTPQAILPHIMGRVFPRAKASNKSYPLSEMPGRGAGKILLLLDEADSLIRYCDRMNEKAFYGELKSFASSGGKLVMAGYREFRDAVLNPQHNLHQTMEQMPLLPFSPGSKSARNLILGPMEDCGIKYWDNDQSVARIMKWSSGHPLYIQLYCQRLVGLCLAQHNDTMDAAMMDSVESDEQVYHRVLDTFNHTTNAIEKCVAYAGTYLDTTFDQADIMNVLQERWRYVPSMNRVMEACETLTLANILSKYSTKYTFLFHALPSLMRTHVSIDRIMPHLIQEAKRDIGS